MITYLMGEINSKDRGELAAVIHHAKGGGDYGAFLYPMNSEEMITITGVQTVHNPIDRVYLGINHATGKKIARESCDLNSSKNVPKDLERIDRLVVMTHFLKKDQ
jgi:hypothetical protein